MTAPAAEKLLTVEEFAQRTDLPGQQTELINGRIMSVTGANAGHGRRAARIDRRLNQFAIAHGLGDTTGEGGYLLRRNPDTVRLPDAAFIANDRIPDGGVPDDRYLVGAPNLVVEIVSPSDRGEEIAQKFREWMEAGAERIWEVQPRLKTVTVHRPGHDPRTLRIEDTLTSDHAAFSVEGFALPVADIFA